MKLKDSDLEMLKYFWESKQDIERYAGFEEIKADLEREFPEIIKAWNDYLMSQRTLDAVISHANRSGIAGAARAK